MADLKRCPFCGESEARVLPPTCTRKTPYNPADRAFPVVRCRCGAEVLGESWDASGESAVAAWNRRAEPAPSPAVERVLEAADEWDQCVADPAKHYKLVHVQWGLREAVAALRDSRKEEQGG